MGACWGRVPALRAWLTTVGWAWRPPLDDRTTRQARRTRLRALRKTLSGVGAGVEAQKKGVDGFANLHLNRVYLVSTNVYLPLPYVPEGVLVAPTYLT